MKPIKTIAGRILLYFYSLQRSDYSKLHDFVLEFQMRHFPDKSEKSPKISHKENEIVRSLLEISDNDNDIYNALKYIADKGFIEMSKNSDNVGDYFLNFCVSSIGIDMIEGIERGEEEKKIFNITFNIKIADSINIESLLKAEIGSLFKASIT